MLSKGNLPKSSSSRAHYSLQSRWKWFNGGGRLYVLHLSDVRTI